MTTHRPRHGQQRSTTERDYGPEHRRERERWRPIVEAGRADCQQGIPGNGSSGTCLYPSRRIFVGQAWALGHNDARTARIGPVHRRCNAADGGSKAVAIINARRSKRAGGRRRLPVGW